MKRGLPCRPPPIPVKAPSGVQSPLFRPGIVLPVGSRLLFLKLYDLDRAFVRRLFETFLIGNKIRALDHFRPFVPQLENLRARFLTHTALCASFLDPNSHNSHELLQLYRFCFDFSLSYELGPYQYRICLTEESASI